VATEASPPDDGGMPRTPVTALTIVGVAVFGFPSTSALGTPASAAFADQVGRICEHALLFDGRHEIGTRAGAIAVSRDIRTTGTHRLRRVAAIPEPRSRRHLIRNWLNVEQRLVATYARDYLLIWDEIEAANTPHQRATLPIRLEALLHDPDALKRQAGVYELELGLPDCTGDGSQTSYAASDH
jgi:hypothetical protein